MRWSDKAKDIARSYRSNCAECEEMTKHMETGTGAQLGIRSGRISKPTEDAVMRAISTKRYQYLQEAIAAVDYALMRVRDKPNGDITVRLYELVYRDGTHRIYGAAMELHISYPTAKRYNQYLLKMIAEYMGYIVTR